MVKFLKAKPEAGGGPMSSIGITRFFDADTKSPKMSPYFVFGAIVVFIIALLIIGAMHLI